MKHDLWQVVDESGLALSYTDQDSAVQIAYGMMDRNPREQVVIRRPNQRAAWWKGANGCGNEMKPNNGEVVQRFCRYEPVDAHCDDCPFYKHTKPRARKGKKR
ncbi:MAG: hypothetical protein ISN29_06640 [Gammaproteobacteria bacterium AqS3]|nr:hypothetical protein [Gammaproteobacteria bacterium AqS3]